MLACLNYYVVKESGESNFSHHEAPYAIRFTRNSDVENLKFYAKLIEQNQGDLQYQYYSNYTAYLMKLGHKESALAILQKLVKLKPQEYQILSNLAVAYELNGQADSALLYLTKSLKINSESHYSSEWFHLMYLKAALQLKDPKVKLDSLNVLHIYEHMNDNVMAMSQSLSIQIVERVPLTASPNKLLSKCLEEAADFFRKEISIDWSVKLYAMALGYAESETIKNRLRNSINTARARIKEICSNNRHYVKNNIVAKELIKKDWLSYIEKDIKFWENYKIDVENNLQILGDSK